MLGTQVARGALPGPRAGLILMSMQRCTLFLLVVALLSPALQASTVELIRVWPGYRTAESFESVGELFGRGEPTGGRILWRSQSPAREGFYFLTRIRSAQAIASAEVRLEVILPGSLIPKVHTFTTPLKAGVTVLHVGVTGTDWPQSEVRPVAWRLSFHDPAQPEPLARQQSFLWATP